MGTTVFVGEVISVMIMDSVPSLLSFVAAPGSSIVPSPRIVCVGLDINVFVGSVNRCKYVGLISTGMV